MGKRNIYNKQQSAIRQQYASRLKVLYVPRGHFKRVKVKKDKTLKRYPFVHSMIEYLMCMNYECL